MTTMFDPWTAAGVTAANRLVRSATWGGWADDSGAVTDQLVSVYEGLARHGIGLVVTGFAFVRPDGKAVPGQIGIYDDALVEGLARLPEATHAHGNTPVFCQIVHAGLNTKAETIGNRSPLAVSAGEFKGYGTAERALETGEIEDLVEAFVQGARRARQAGFDGVQLHMAHGYLGSQFLSPLTNRREDEYGGDVERRARFAVDVTRAVRREVGPDYPLAAKLTGDDFAEGGLEIADAVRSARALVDAGLDWIEVSGGCPASGRNGPARARIDSPEKEGYLRHLARAVRQAVDVPVVTVGGYRSPAVIEDVLSSGDADAVALSRPFICEPELADRWSSGDRSPSRCISCLGCFKTAYRGGLYCVTRAEAEADGTW